MILAVATENLNLAANILTIFGMVAAAFVLYQLWKMNRRLEMALAPKLGIEGYLTMCGQVVEADPDGTCVVNDTGEIVLVNERFENISGYHRSSLLGEQVEMLVPDDMRNIHHSHRDGFVMRPSARPMRGLKLKHRNGKELDVQIRLNRYVDSSGGYTIAKVRVPE